jgi:phosphatidylglycerophosphate synthase
LALDQSLRHLKERVLRPVARRAGMRLHPNAVTLVGFGIGLLSAGGAATGAYLLGLALWLINRFLDGLDGTLARETGRQSDFGAYLDILTDFVVYALIPVALAFSRNTLETYLALAVLLTSFYVNAASWMYLSSLLERRSQGAAARGEYTSITMPTGLIEGTETIAFYVLFFLFPQHITLLFGVMAAGVAVTIAQRVAWARRQFLQKSG